MHRPAAEPARRLAAWDGALVRWADSVIGRPWAWGATDCASLVRGATEAMYGQPLFEHLPHWHTLRGAREALEETGGVVAALERLGATRIPMSHIQQGDIAVLPVPEIDQDGLGTDDVWVCVSGRLVGCNPDSRVELWEIHRGATDELFALRLPHEVTLP